MIRDSAGNLYGTTRVGGAYGAGVVFKVDPAEIESTLYSFTGGADGSEPLGGVIRDAAGNLYGTTASGGDLRACPSPENGCGVVFKLDTTGKQTVLHGFHSGVDGKQPESTLTVDAAGNLYGITTLGGTISPLCPFGCGVVFRIKP